MPQYRLDCFHHFHQNVLCGPCHRLPSGTIVTTDTIVMRHPGPTTAAWCRGVLSPMGVPIVLFR